MRTLLEIKKYLQLCSTLFFVLCASACALDSRISALNAISAGDQNHNPNDGSTPSTPDDSGSSPVSAKRSGAPYFNYHIRKVNIDSAGRAIYAGDFTAFTFNKYNYLSRIMRLNTDGSLDTTFDTGVGVNSATNKILMTAANDIILAGGFWEYDVNSVPAVFKITPDGDYVSSYAPGIFSVYDAVMTSSEQIVAIGDFYYWGTFANTQNGIVRINADGTRDTSFNIGSSFLPVRTAYSIKVQNDGKFVIGGNFTSYNGTSSPKLVRLNTNGTIDTTLAVGTGFNAVVYTVELLSDGSIIALGDFTSYKGTSGVNRIAKISSTGTLDATFTANVGSGFTFAPGSVKEIPGVGILIGGYFTTYKGNPAPGIVCLNLNGTQCTNFNIGTGPANASGTPAIRDFVKIDANTVLLVGDFTSFNSQAHSNLVALNLDGSFSNRMSGYKGVDAAITKVIMQPDGKLVMTGDFMLYEPIPVTGLVRFNLDKTLDEIFMDNVKSSLPAYYAGDVVIDSQDRLWISGQINASGSYTAANLMRINSDGLLDTACTSALGSGFSAYTRSLTLQSNGKILVTGDFTTVNGTTARKVARVNDNCTLDSGFSTGTGATGQIDKSYVLSTGKILHVGSNTFTSYNGTTVSKVVRVNSNGTIDGTYPNNSSKPSYVYGSAIDSLDRLYILGSSGTYNGTAVGTVYRVQANGTVDTTFNIGTGFDLLPTVIKVFNNKIYVGGAFTTYNGVPAKNFVILNEDGSVNNTIQKPTALLPVDDINLTPDGKIEFAYKVLEVTY